jgi:hypothetical protein
MYPAAWAGLIYANCVLQMGRAFPETKSAREFSAAWADQGQSAELIKKQADYMRGLGFEI